MKEYNDILNRNNSIKSAHSFSRRYKKISKYSKNTIGKAFSSYEDNIFFDNMSINKMDFFMKNCKENNDSFNSLLSSSIFYTKDASLYHKNIYLNEIIDNNFIPLKNENPYKSNFNLIIKNRKSIRNFNEKYIMEYNDLSKILNTCFQFNEKINKRPYPSGGGLYPIYIYIYINNVRNIKNGVYKYYPFSKGIKLINDIKINISEILSVNNIKHNGYSFLIFYIYESNINRLKYGDIALIYACLEAGSMMQNIQLFAAENNKIGVCDLGGYKIKKILENLKLNEYFGNYLLNVTIVGGKDNG